MKARDLTFAPVDDGSCIRRKIQEIHYSKKCPPATFYFGVYFCGELIGGMTFRRPSLPKIQKCYGTDLELNRLAIIDAAGKNSESRFIGYCLRWLAKHTDHKCVISYADPHHGHQGKIYAASNFRYFGLENGHGTRLLNVNGELMQAKTAYDRYGASGKNLEKNTRCIGNGHRHAAQTCVDLPT